MFPPFSSQLSFFFFSKAVLLQLKILKLNIALVGKILLKNNATYSFLDEDTTIQKVVTKQMADSYLVAET